MSEGVKKGRKGDRGNPDPPMSNTFRRAWIDFLEVSSCD